MTAEARAGLIRSVLDRYAASLVAVYLFGSEARGEASAGSDVDLGVLFAEPPAPTLDNVGFQLEAELERALGREVQVVVLNDASPDLVHRVLRDGRLLLDRDTSRRIAFEVRARNEYFDLLPHLLRYRRLETSVDRPRAPGQEAGRG